MKIINNGNIINDPFILEKGDNNLLQIDSETQFGMHGKPKIIINGSNNRIILQKNIEFRSGTIEILGNNNTVLIRNGVIIRQATFFCAEGHTIDLGENGGYASGVEIHTSDRHKIYDTKTGNRVNLGGNVAIGNNVWMAKKSWIKGDSNIEIASYCVIGYGAFVDHSYLEPNCIIGGVPSKIIARNRISDFVNVYS